MKNIGNGWTPEEFSYIDLSPDESVGEAHRAWQGCPTVAVTRGGRLFAGWFTGGLLEPCIHNYNVLIMSDDRGESWSAPILTVGTDTEKRLRKIDVELWVDGKGALWMMWVVTPYYESSLPATIRTPFVFDYMREFYGTEVMVCRDPDADVLVWERPRALCEGFMRNKPIVTSSGRIIAPAYDYEGTHYPLRLSDNGGESFRSVVACKKPDVNTFDEIAVCERRVGELRFLARTIRGCYLYSDSFDNGETWTEAQEYEKAPSSRCYYGKLKNGMIVQVRNADDARRAGLKIRLSEDGGDTFPYEMVLDARENVSYPDLAEDENGNLYIVYDRERDNRIKLNRESWVSEAAKEILLCRLTAEDIKRGRLADGSFVGRVVSKAQINTVEA